MLISLTLVETTMNGTLEKEKRDYAVSQWTHRGLSVTTAFHSPPKRGVLGGIKIKLINKVLKTNKKLFASCVFWSKINLFIY